MPEAIGLEGKVCLVHGFQGFSRSCYFGAAVVSGVGGRVHRDGQEGQTGTERYTERPRKLEGDGETRREKQREKETERGRGMGRMVRVSFMARPQWRSFVPPGPTSEGSSGTRAWRLI